jgi:hypothetical protein
VPIDPPNPQATQEDPSDPPGFRREAEAAFADLIKASGKTIHTTPTSCELYIRQYLGAFEAERNALIEALRRGVPDRIVKHPSGGGEEYEEFLKGEAAILVKDANLAAGTAGGAVKCWAAGVGRPIGGPAQRVVARSLEVKNQKAETADDTLRALMAAISGAGGVVGGFFGNGVVFLILLVSTIRIEPSEPDTADIETAQALALGIVLTTMIIGSVAGGLGGFLGWLMGRGDERPWIGFVSTCGTAFLAGAISGRFSPGLASAVVTMIAAFGASYTAASSGGYRS